ncbi:MAG TPA: hypothetical protein VK468_00735 [Pyrinomonadaceae bacterium]|jgi:hypothetical protein|nr:hypothetical protein [Pyrinomonadaceae bacterium]
MMLIFDVGTSTGMTALAAGALFFVVFAAVAYIAFRLLRKTVKMAFRMAVVAAVLLAAVAGVASFWWFTSSPSPKPRPGAARTR